MCDETDLQRMFDVNRRRFGAMVGAATLAACTGLDSEPASGATEADLSERMVRIATPDGEADAFWVHPRAGQHAAVLLWPDIAGLRDAFYDMSRRLAARGYSVLTVNPYYRDVPGEQFPSFEAFADQNGFSAVGPWREKLEADAIMRDASASAAWLDEQDAVDTTQGIGTQGYCMGGPFTVWSAAAVPNRIKAAASFHGGGLVRDGEESPHRLLERTDAQFLFAIAQNDDAKDADAKTTLRQAAIAANREAEVEVYPADHGWTVPDSPAYAHDPAERAWTRLIALYDRAL